MPFRMTVEIELKSIRFYAFHGVAEQERQVGNHFVVDLLLEADVMKAVESDELKDTINYAEVYEVLRKEMMIPSALLEHAAGRMLKALKDRFPQLRSVTLRLAKMNPPFGADIESAAVILKEHFVR